MVKVVAVVGGIVVVVVVVEVVVVVVAAGSFDDVHETMISAVAASKYERDLMNVDSIR